MKIICLGRNYSEHAKELGNEVPTEPVIFIKPDTAVLKGSDFYIPEFSDNIHYELELVIKISKGGKYIQKENAGKHYDEIGLGIDFTARDVQDKLKSKGLPWEIAKGFDGSAAVGPMVSKTTLEGDINFQLFKNKELVQDGHSADMIFDFDSIIEQVSKYFTLRVGDLIFTGTPKGVGPVAEDDILEAYLDGKKWIDLRVC